MEIFQKISSYNIFNYILPGAVFSFWLTKFSGLNILQTNIFTSIFLYYFLGMVISRFGSLLVEPLLQKIGVVKYEDYDNYLLASQENEKLNILLEVNNMYRTFVALFALVGLIHIYLYIGSKIKFLNEQGIFIAVIALIFLFLFSYRKQTKYITARIRKHKSE